MTKQCKALTKKGRRCPNSASESGYCFTHDPARAKERAEARKRGGRNKRTSKIADTSQVLIPVRDVPGVLSILDVAVLDTLAQENSSQRTRGLISIAMAYLKAFEVGELEARINSLEFDLIRRNNYEQENIQATKKLP